MRLLTLIGPGGVGKTCLAVEVAAHLQADVGAVAFVGLTAISGAELVLPAIARELGLHDSDGTPAGERLQTYLQRRGLLLVLDNLEHVIGAANDVGELVRTCLELKVLVTSRQALRLRWEHAVQLLPLALPDLRRAARSAEAPRGAHAADLNPPAGPTAAAPLGLGAPSSRR